MEPATTHEQRLVDLEIKLSFTEDLLEELNKTVVQQQRQIELLIREVTDLRQRTEDSATPVFRSLRDELPPHY